ncbi:hypothetical protein VDIAB_110409 [Vibrio diabolicus]|nr:hypothetical protein VDIAB_110409 [Vibrio diabolicus]
MSELSSIKNNQFNEYFNVNMVVYRFVVKLLLISSNKIKNWN